MNPFFWTQTQFLFLFYIANSIVKNQIFNSKLNLNMLNNCFLLISFTINNVFFTIVDFKGNVVFLKTIGSNKVKGLKKLTFYLIKLTLKEVLFFVIKKKIKLHIKMKGLNKFKKTTIKILTKEIKENVLTIIDDTSIPHNGCKKRKKRRL